MGDPPPSTPLPPPKRRRLSATSTLRKPFRSPLLNRPPGSTPAPPKFALPTPSSTPSSTKSAPASSSENSQPTPLASKASSSAKRPLATPTKLPPPSPLSTPRRRPLFSAPTPSDPELAAAQKKHTALLSEIRTLKQSMETVTQAIALEANPQGDEDLAASIRKWRLAARSAADTLFGIAGDKVNQLGGPGGDAWRTMMGGGKKSFGWDEEEPKRPGTDDEGDGDEGIGGEDEREEESKKSDEEWGMELMLKTFGIPLKMLGWDKEADCWKPMEEMEEELA